MPRIVANGGSGPSPTPATLITGVGGWDGEPGVDGADGQPGQNGAPGAQGVKGSDGFDGEPGLPGEEGMSGQRGLQGPAGPQGAAGFDGEPGLPGDDGFASPSQLAYQRMRLVAIVSGSVNNAASADSAAFTLLGGEIPWLVYYMTSTVTVDTEWASAGTGDLDFVFFRLNAEASTVVHVRVRNLSGTTQTFRYAVYGVSP